VKKSVTQIHVEKDSKNTQGSMKKTVRKSKSLCGVKKSVTQIQVSRKATVRKSTRSAKKTGRTPTAI
jgi:hypothetical protein